MAVVAISDSILTDIADAIRSKNGQETLYKPSEMPDAIEAISGGGITPTGTIEITQNGVVDVTNYASADVDVPNSYSAGDEGKVVSSGALVAQTSDTVTENDTYDTTLINSLTVNVPTGGGSSVATGTYTPESNVAGHIFDVGDSSLNHFLIYALSTPYGNGVRVSCLGYVDFDLGKSYLIASNSSGSAGAGSWSFNGAGNGFSKSGSSVTISTSTGTNYFNYFISGVTYKWFAW